MADLGIRIETIIEDLVSQDIKLSNTLLKVQVLAYKIKNEDLKKWVNNELNGYIGIDKPKYRIVPSAVYGNLVQEAGFKIFQKNNVPLPIEYLDEEIRNRLSKIAVDSKVAELENMIDRGGNMQINIPYFICQKFSEKMNWHIDMAWQEFTPNAIVGIMSTIKSTLLNFLLELQTEFGEYDYSKLFEKKDEVDNIFKETIGKIEGKNINITLGNDNIQSTNYGKQAKINLSKGDNTSQKIEDSLQKESLEILDQLTEKLEQLNLSKVDKNDLQDEIERIKKQFSKKNPRKTIVKTGFKVIYDLLISVGGNIMTSSLIENIQKILYKL